MTGHKHHGPFGKFSIVSYGQRRYGLSRCLLQSWPLVKWGSSGHPVPALQYLLRARGHEVAVDGIFGAKTAAAVRGFQRAVLLTPDGIAGSMTWRALVSGMLSF